MSERKKEKQTLKESIVRRRTTLTLQTAVLTRMLLLSAITMTLS